MQVTKRQIANHAQPLYLRPHHGLCLLNYRGHGYSDAFSVRMEATLQILREHPETPVEIARGCDSLCAVCPNRDGTACTSAHPDLFDQNVLKATGFAAGQVLPWSELSAATNPLSLYHLDEICPDCSWLDLCKEIAAERIQGQNQADRGIHATPAEPSRHVQRREIK